MCDVWWGPAGELHVALVVVGGGRLDVRKNEARAWWPPHVLECLSSARLSDAECGSREGVAVSHRPRCPTCRERLHFFTQDGALFERCRCGERTVPTTGTRAHDQRPMLDAKLAERVERCHA